jgi:hypothetical protein
MPRLIVQAVTISGKIIDKGRWEVDFPAGLQQDQTMSLNLPVKDPALIKYLGKQQSKNCIIDQEDDDTYMVAVGCKILRIRHMLNATTKTCESMAFATPEDRTCEAVLLYLLQPKDLDPRFIVLVRGIQPVQPPST